MTHSIDKQRTVGRRHNAARLLRLPSLLILSALLTLVAACSSTGAGSRLDSVGHPARIRFVSSASQHSFELVNETHTGRVELYSTTRASADIKVQTDEVVDEVLVHFAKLGLNERLQAGAAPPPSGGTWSMLEIDVAGEALHFTVGAGSSVEDRDLYIKCRQTFLLVYNQTYQLQSVKREHGWSPSVPTR